MSLWDENPPPLAEGDVIPQQGRTVAEQPQGNGQLAGDPRNYLSGSAPGATPGPSAGKTTPRRKSHGFGGKQITRTRVSYSCHTCRRRKVKCDKVHPVCGNCVKTGTECMYDSTAAAAQRSRAEDNHQRVKRKRDVSKLAEKDELDLSSPQESLRELLNYQARLRDQKSGSDEIATRLDRLTSMIERLSRTGDAHSMEGNTAGGGSASSNFAGRSGIVDGASGRPRNKSVSSSASVSRQSSPRRNSDDASNDDFPIPAGLSTDLVDPVGTLNLGHLSLEDSGRSRYVGTTYWAYISDEINELNQLLRNQNRSQPPIIPQPTPSNGGNDPSISPVQKPDESNGQVQQWLATHESNMHDSVLYPKAGGPSSHIKPIQADMLNHVPTRHQSNILYKSFMSGVQAISPVLHPPNVLKSYEEFWDWYVMYRQPGAPYPRPSFIPLLYAIWYGGSVTVSLKTIHAEFSLESRSALTEPFHDEVTRWLKTISFPRSPSLNGLAAFLLVQTILSKEEEPLTSSLFISLALRVAQTMGLHRDPAQFGISHCEAEMRRRMWWHIVHMDGVVAMSSGLPPLVSDENYWDVRLTSEVKDTLLTSPEAEVYERMVDEGYRRPDKPDDPSICGNSMVNVYYISAKGKYIMARAIRKILKIQLGTRPVTRKDMEDLKSVLVDLQFKLHALVDRISSPKRPSANSDATRCIKPDLPNGGPGCGEQYHTPVLTAFHKWAKILLSLFVHKAFCVAYQPFLKNAKSKIWPAARQCALRHCHGFMEKFILLATDPDFQPFQWSWPGNHQPMHATMIMLIDLYERPTSSEAPKSRAFIDKIFSLSGPDGGVVGGEDGVTTSRPLNDGGREAWDMMRRLREKAWLKAGLDPQLLWTEQAQVQAGVAPVRSPSVSTTSTRNPERSLKDQSASPTTNFADSYYAMIKNSYDDHRHVRQASAESSRARDKQPITFATLPQQQQQIPSPTCTIPVVANTTTPQPSSNAFLWPSQPVYQNPSGPLNQMPALGQRDARGYLNPNSAKFVALAGDRANMAPPIGLKIETSQPALADIPLQVIPQQRPQLSQQTQQASPQQQQQRPQPPPQPQQQPPHPSAFEPNVNFDWDQWDAVFGQYLPIIDGYMDLDNNEPQTNPSDLPLSSTVQVSDGEMGIHDRTMPGPSNNRNWADFG
ncbi:C6 transcription factor [Trichophyton violaceum]|uniref:C6 finger domain transcription factor nscR n=1 Tax=Trichophyton violaceum TaxID=34388 RepID=A0A178FBX3_TRIVO|nr:C6 transcription factor [Trichophyton violaceum]